MKSISIAPIMAAGDKSKYQMIINDKLGGDDAKHQRLKRNGQTGVASIIGECDGK